MGRERTAKPGKQSHSLPPRLVPTVRQTWSLWVTRQNKGHRKVLGAIAASWRQLSPQLTCGCGTTRATSTLPAYGGITSTPPRSIPGHQSWCIPLVLVQPMQDTGILQGCPYCVGADGVPSDPQCCAYPSIQSMCPAFQEHCCGKFHFCVEAFESLQSKSEFYGK